MASLRLRRQTITSEFRLEGRSLWIAPVKWFMEGQLRLNGSDGMVIGFCFCARERKGGRDEARRNKPDSNIRGVKRGSSSEAE